MNEKTSGDWDGDSVICGRPNEILDHLSVACTFLGEATLLSLLGGVLGVMIGIGGSLRWPTRIPTEALFVAVLFSAAVGVFFGFYPAYKASHLDPIEALRYE